MEATTNDLLFEDCLGEIAVDGSAVSSYATLQHSAHVHHHGRWFLLTEDSSARVCPREPTTTPIEECIAEANRIRVHEAIEEWRRVRGFTTPTILTSISEACVPADLLDLHPDDMDANEPRDDNECANLVVAVVIFAVVLWGAIFSVALVI